MAMQKCRAMTGCVPVLPAIHLMAQMAILQELLQVLAILIKVQDGVLCRITLAVLLTGAIVSAVITITKAVNKVTEALGTVVTPAVGTDAASSG